jgi:hypothetical protein
MAVILRADDDALTHVELDANFTSLLPTTNGQLVIGNTSNARSPTIGTLTPGNGIDITNGAGSITITAETASTTNPGVVELATVTETNTGTDATRAVTPDGLDGWTGSAQLATLGTITAGTWNGSVIAEAYLQNQSGTNTGDEPDASASVAGIVTTGTQTFGGAKTFNSAVTISDSTASTSTTTGALKVTGGVGVQGALYATSKSFDIPHPTKEGMGLRHGSLEGPEFGVYVRGKTTEQVIDLPDYWVGLVDESTITVQLTAIEHPQQLWVKKIENNQVHIRSVDQVNCYYHIYAERKDIDKLEVEYE